MSTEHRSESWGLVGFFDHTVHTFRKVDCEKQGENELVHLASIGVASEPPEVQKLG